MALITALREQVIAVVSNVQRLPYAWPSPSDAASARQTGTGSCSSKHALLAEELEALGIPTLPLLLVGPLVPAVLAADPDLAPSARLPEVHECLTVHLPWAGPCRIDVTWDPILVSHGLPGTLDWDGESDMAVAVGETGPGWSVERSSLRKAKEALRARLYLPGERELRDAVLATLSKRFACWRVESPSRTPARAECN